MQDQTIAAELAALRTRRRAGLVALVALPVALYAVSRSYLPMLGLSADLVALIANVGLLIGFSIPLPFFANAKCPRCKEPFFQVRAPVLGIKPVKVFAGSCQNCMQSLSDKDK